MAQPNEITTKSNDTIAMSPPFRFPLPFDPIRLLAGILSRWPWIIIGMLVFGSIGAIIGKSLTHQTFSISVSLMKRRVPETVQTSEIGQAFRPADLNDATLLATLIASEPLDLAFKRANNGISPSRSAGLVEASQLENTDIFYITYHSFISSEDALQVSGILAEEVIEYTKRLQQSEALSVRAILLKEVTALDKRIEKTNSEILEFAKSKDFIGGESQVAAVLGKLSQLELQLDEARASEKSLKEQLAELNEKIRSHSPLNVRMRSAREELAELRATYTDDNPLVQTKLEAISYLEQQINDLDANKDVNIESFTGTPLGNQLYLDIIDVRNRRADAANRVAALEKQRVVTANRLSDFPAIITQYDALRAKRDSYIGELSLMSKRLKEAEIFASGSPGYWQIFQPPDARNLMPSSLIKKPAILGVAGAFCGVIISIFITLLLTQRSTRRSVLECCACTRAPLAALLPVHPGEPSGFGNFWLSTLAPSLANNRGSLLLCTSALEAEEERKFWDELAIAVSGDTDSLLHVLDLTPDELWQEKALPSNISWSSDDSKIENRTILRASGLPQMQRREHLSHIYRWYTLIAGKKCSLRSYASSRELIEVYLKRCDGTVVFTEPAKGFFRVLADRLSISLTRRFS